MSISTKPPTGTRDFLPETMAQRRWVIGVVEEVYRRYGFLPLETPALENLSTLLGKYGEEGDQLIFRLLHRGEKLGRVLDGAPESVSESRLADLGLRYDLTVPLARVVAEHGARLPKFFRRYQIQPVWRADRPARGRFREFYQCDADIIGSTSMAVEVELLSAVCEIFDGLGFTDVSIKLNHRQLLFALVDAAGIPADKETEALVAMDKLDKIGVEGVEAELAGRGIAPGAIEALRPVLAQELDASGDAVLDRLELRVGGSERGRQGIADLRELLALSARTAAHGRLTLDPVLARGLSYYTGPIFEVHVADLAGSLAGGGRYDELIGMFLGRPVPACGIALGLERILVVMAEREMFGSLKTGPDVLVCYWSAELGGESLALATELRRAGLAVELYPEPTKLGKQLKYASSRDIPLVAIMAPDEVERGAVQLKDLRGGDQHDLLRAEVAERARALLRDR
ncbi:MAG: histidine--tRNA ligase [bacterium]